MQFSFSHCNIPVLSWINEFFVFNNNLALKSSLFSGAAAGFLLTHVSIFYELAMWDVAIIFYKFRTS